ncbi:hypothetical protein EI94DRAFT_1724616 [Lactarius quietus]|nr:hypothetical protein EI94DRAFT_1724616 [Lactarius quietus]
MVRSCNAHRRLSRHFALPPAHSAHHLYRRYVHGRMLPNGPILPLTAKSATNSLRCHVISLSATHGELPFPLHYPVTEEPDRVCTTEAFDKVQVLCSAAICNRKRNMGRMYIDESLGQVGVVVAGSITVVTSIHFLLLLSAASSC